MAFLTEQDRTYKTPEDICAHVGDDYAAFGGAIVPPIFQNSLFVQPTDVNGIAENEYVYSRVSNPTVEIAERKIAALEGADGALCFSSGMAAISSAILYYMRKDCHIVLVGSAYGPAVNFIRQYLGPKFGVTTTIVMGSDVHEIEAAIRPETTLIYLESPSSCVFMMQDLDAITAIARARGIGTCIDNSYATPLHQQPLAHGVDIVLHTASKYLGGHSDIVAGALAARREIIEHIQHNERELLGGIMDPHQAWLLIRGIRTLPVRLRQHGESAAKVAAFLENHPKVTKLYYPGSERYDQKELFRKYLTGTNGLMSFTTTGDNAQVERFANSLRCFQRGCSWGGFESLVVIIGWNEDMGRYGVPKNLVRIHVGLEDPDTLIRNLEAAFALLPDA
ncbi:MAG: aminotransferase class I/II-fold pyridoxal phosphate-dependent enzyme [Oscillospiraceae bacterium]|nr:aminotransferase class I/II-fold pyridoxal phosphate-dependent enzyme [Oscillospiraceae bacterium]